MEKRKLKATRQLQCIAALRYNTHFEKEVKAIRQRYAIPQDVTEAKDWFTNLLSKHKKNTFAYFFKLFFENRRLPYGEAAFSLDFKEGFPSILSKGSVGMESILQTEIPLELSILLLLPRFGLPMSMYFTILQYTLTEEKFWLHPSWFKPTVKHEFGIETGQVESTVTITGLAPWTTKKQWDDIWDSEVKPLLKIQGKALGIAKLARNRTTLESLEKEMKRYAEWYQLIIVQGLKVKEALTKWENEHPEQVDPNKPYDESTVSRALQEFCEIIKPTPH